MNRDASVIMGLSSLPVLGKADTAQVLGVSVGTLDVEIRSGRLPVIRVGTRGRRVLISKADRDRWLEGGSRAWSSADAV